MEECLKFNKEKNENYINDTKAKQNIVDIICQNVTGIVQKLVEFKPPPTAEFYLAPSTFVTNAQAIIENQNKLKEQNVENTVNNIDNDVIEENKENPEKDNLNIESTEDDIKSKTDDPNVSENKDNESSLIVEDNKNENDKEIDKSNESNEKKEEIKEIIESNEKSDTGEVNEATDIKNDENTNTSNIENIENNINSDENKEKSNSQEPTSAETISNEEKKEEEIKKNMKISEDVINLILNKPETNKIIDKEISRNATIINLLNDEEVNAINLIEVLRYIEEKTNELLVFNYMTHLPKRKDPSDGEIKTTEKIFINNDELNSTPNITLLGPGPEAPITNLNIKIPESEDSLDYINNGDEENRLFTREELTKRTIININNKTKNKEDNNNQIN